MIAHEHEEIQFFTFESFPNSRLKHAVFGRSGGVSPVPYNSLNMSISTGDSLENVRENRRRAYAAVEVPFDSMATLWQVHGTETINIHSTPCDPLTKADALITNRTDVSIFLRFADCVPILLYDPIHVAIGIAHAGWRGTVAGMARCVVNAMQRAYNSVPADLLVGIGPSISVERYDVGEEVVAAVNQAFPEPGDILQRQGEKIRLDLWKANTRMLEECGVREIEVAAICTATNRQTFFSHRGDAGQSGRFGAVIALSN